MVLSFVVAMLLVVGQHLTLPRSKTISSHRHGGQALRGAIHGGFRSVHFYNGVYKPLRNDTKPSYSQSSKQDTMVKSLFDGKKNGYFIDLAANDAVDMSNTFVLERDLGWDGLCIEANHRYLWRLAARKCQVIAAVVSAKDNKLVDFSFRGADSGIVGTRSVDSETRSSVTLERILDEFGAPAKIDYLSLDVEGAEEEIMRSFPFGRYIFSMITVERPSRALQEILRHNNYSFLHTKGGFGDLCFIHQSMPNYAQHLEHFNPAKLTGVVCRPYDRNQPTRLWEWCIGSQDEIEHAKPPSVGVKHSKALDYFKKRLHKDLLLLREKPG